MHDNRVTVVTLASAREIKAIRFKRDCDKQRELRAARKAQRQARKVSQRQRKR
jgi:hypothetical protein